MKTDISEGFRVFAKIHVTEVNDGLAHHYNEFNSNTIHIITH